MLRLWVFFSLACVWCACGQVTQTPSSGNAQTVALLDTIKTDRTLPQRTFTKEELMGKITYAKDPDFVQLRTPYTKVEQMYLRKEVAEAFEQMWMAAQHDGVYITIVSGTRDFTHQCSIWNRKWNALGTRRKMSGVEKCRDIMLYSAMPGCSRHHWGTDMDINSLNNSDFSVGAKWNKTYEWMVAHAHEYGFCQVYSARSTGRATGYEEERWHWSYMPLSRPMLEQYIRLVSTQDITGFEGAEHATALNVIEHYVRGIAEECK